MNAEFRSPEASGDDFEELVIRYWDNALSERELAELNARLAADADLRARFNELCLQNVAISERLAAEKAATPIPVRPHRRRVLLGTAAAAGVLAAAGLKALGLWPFHGNTATDEVPVARLEDAAGAVFFTDADNQERPLALNQALQPGQAVSTVGTNSSARIRCADGTYLVLGQNSSATLLDSRVEKIRLDRGGLGADVRPRPESRPLHIMTTGNSEVIARGAKVLLESSVAQTSVVHSAERDKGTGGSVQVKRLSDGQSVPIEPGQRAVVNPEGDMRPEALPPTPDTWTVEIGPTLPPAWACGELVFEDLPPGARAAVRAAPFRETNGRIYHKVQTQKDWTNGLFLIHDDSRLQVRFRIDKPGFFHALIVTRDPDASRRICVVLEATHFWMNREPRKWYTVDLPFAQFRPTVPNIKADKPLVAFIVLFDCQGVDRGLTIDRFSITRGSEARRV